MNRALRRWCSAAWPAMAIVLLVVLAYWPGRHGGFVLDDQQNITRNPALQAVHGFHLQDIAIAAMSSPASGTERPLAMLSFALNHAATGADPAPMKVTNIAIHALNALLVLLLLRRLLDIAMPAAGEHLRRWTARFGAAAWALHPIQATAVLYVVQRMESLSHVFVFSGLWLYLLGRERQLAGRTGAILVATGLVAGTGLGMLAKESAVLLPLYALCIEACLLRFRGRDGAIRALAAAYAAMGAAAMLAAAFWLWPRVAPAYEIRDFTVLERLATEPRVLFDYLRWILLPAPSSLGVYHDDIIVSRGLLQPPSTLLALLGLAALVVVAWRLRPRWPLASLGIAWFLAAHALTATFIPLELAYEHRNYFATLGACLVLAEVLLLATPRSWGKVGATLAILLVVVFSGVTTLRAVEWSDPYKFAFSEAAKRPGSARAQYERASALVRLTGYRADSPLLPEAWRSLERARDVSGSDTMPHQAALVLASLTGTARTHDRWWPDMEARLRDQPLHSQNLTAVVNLGDCAANGVCKFPPERMLGIYAAALSHGPQPTILASYGKYAVHVLGDRPLALRLWTDAIAADPGNAQFRYNLARLHLLMGSRAQAQQQIDELRRRGPIANRALVSDLEGRLDRTMP